jgi:hypothetical protein
MRPMRPGAVPREIQPNDLFPSAIFSPPIIFLGPSPPSLFSAGDCLAQKPNSVGSTPFSHFAALRVDAAQQHGGSDGREVEHGARQTKSKPVWHAPRLTLAPCHPSAPLRFSFRPPCRAFCCAAREVKNKTPTRRSKGKKMLISNNNSKTNTNNFWQLTRASVDGLAQAIESGHAEALSTYLGVMARFHTYSAKNAILIAAQFPNATHLEGIRSWNELGRFVRPGEKGIYILAPTVAVKNQNQAQTKEEVSAQGKKTKGKKAPEPPKEPAQPETVLLGFRGVYVFDADRRGATAGISKACGHERDSRKAHSFCDRPGHDH